MDSFNFGDSVGTSHDLQNTGRPTTQQSAITQKSATSQQSATTQQSAAIQPPARPAFYQHSPGSSGSHTSFRGGNGDRHDVMVKYLYKKCVQHRWLEPSSDNMSIDTLSDTSSLGVVLKRPGGVFVSEPSEISSRLLRVVEQLGAPVAFTMSSEITDALFNQITPLQTEIPLDPLGAMLPIVNSIEDVISMGKASATQNTYMCACRRNRFVLVWGDSAQGIVTHGEDVETRLIGLVWGGPMTPRPTTGYRMSSANLLLDSAGQSTATLPVNPRMTYMLNANPGATTSDSSWDEKLGVIEHAVEKEERGDQAFDPERDGLAPPPRPFLLVHALLVGLAMVLAVVVEMACVAKMVTEYRLDGNVIRFALVFTIPLFATFSLFFMIVITGSLFQLFGPLSGVHGNSRFYSAIKPKPERYPDLELPHVTIQMPVYKEGLKGVILPTITSLVAAVKFYESKGGTASIFVNDDGMQLVKPELAEARKAFYEINNIGWCSRPGQCTTKDDPKYFLRKGQFKKASNMNYCLDFSIRVEDELLRLMDVACAERGCTHLDLTIEEEDELYKQARDTTIELDGGRTWADGDVRMGEVILLIDSDTRVPEDCLLYGALEMHESPEVALLQHGSGILQVVGNAFENGITYFTNLVYSSIQFAVGNGDCAPFVGHNTFIRWRAIQSIAWEEDNMTKFWSDSHVSEDFDVSLRLQMAGFVVRLATYHHGGFKEGVSLTVYDELARWEKYAYGCNELVFNPLIRWPTKGPFTRLFRRFLFSNIKITSKITILGYIGTYYAVASAVPLSLVNYLLVGWFDDSIDQFYLTSWKIFVGMAVIFNILSPLGYAMLRHRLGQKTFFSGLWETIKWTPFFLLFFGGISFHLLKALICHFFSIKMEWTTTAKELEAGGFRIGLDRIVRDFKWMYLIMFVLMCGVVYLACFASYDWYITDFSAIVPLINQLACHMLLPFALGLF